MNIIHCISSPRNISTALMYAFAQRRDTQVVDEPFYAHYLDQTEKIHPGRDEILASQPKAYEDVFNSLYSQDCEVLYIKNMAHHMHIVPFQLFEEFKTVLLIRNPAQLIASFAQIFDNPNMTDIGVAAQYQVWQHLEKLGRNVVVLDSGELLKSPTQVLQDMCERLEIPFSENMLNWKAGPRKEDGVWAKYWYKNVHKSTGFVKQQTSSRPFPKHCNSLLSEAQPMYLELYSHAIKAK